MTSVDTTWQQTIHMVCPDLVVDRVLASTAKSTVLTAALDGQPVVVKVLTATDDARWRSRFANEIATYRAFTVTPPPLPVAHLVAADADAGVLVVTLLDGTPISADRYPPTLSEPAVATLLTAATTLRTWLVEAQSFASDYDYTDRFARYHQQYGLLDDTDLTALTALVAAAGPTEFAHGDLLPANVLHRPGRGVAGVLDWEFAGWYLPGADLALLWVLLATLPGVHHHVEDLLADDVAAQAGFWSNVAAVIARERRIHAELPTGPQRSVRLARLAMTWDTARQQIHALAGAL